ncbi:MAG: hypothetical protein HYV92_02800 [Candidatus Rokubacteria bacterium]|nr:hypothetical protein [Candidatus Rokubacteria bacterium]
MLAAFYIADELFQTRDAGRQKDGAAAERVSALLELLEKTARPS